MKWRGFSARINIAGIPRVVWIRQERKPSEPRGIRWAAGAGAVEESGVEGSEEDEERYLDGLRNRALLRPPPPPPDDPYPRLCTRTPYLPPPWRDPMIATRALLPLSLTA
uniref:Uncharacterized protein n=1 Tax=Oryza brachyantha TaxID=4533 RepID=J3M2G4_ORYBR